MIPNKYDTDGECNKRGMDSSGMFSLIASAKGWKVTPSSQNEDINEHWDLLMEKGKYSIKVDVKGMKKINRKDDLTQDDWHWIELHGVREKDPGWLYGGKSEYIVFETKISFILVERQKLIQLVSQEVDFSRVAYKPEDAPYAIYYRRREGHDKLTLIETKKLIGIKTDEWRK